MILLIRMGYVYTIHATIQCFCSGTTYLFNIFFVGDPLSSPNKKNTAKKVRPCDFSPGCPTKLDFRDSRADVPPKAYGWHVKMGGPLEEEISELGNQPFFFGIYPLVN